MSGDTYYRNYNGGNEGNSRNGSSSSDHSIVLSAGKLLVGAATVTAVAAGALLAGMIKGSAELAKAGIKAYKKRKDEADAAENDMIQRAKAATERRKAAEKNAAARYRQHIKENTPSDKGPSRTAKQFVVTAAERRKQADHEAERLDKELTERLSSLEKTIAANSAEYVVHHCESMRRDWQIRREHLAKQEISALDKRLEALHRSMTECFNGIQQNSQIREIAEQALADACCIVDALVGLPGAMSFSSTECSFLLQKLRKASQFLDGGNYELSFAESCDCVMQTREVYVDTLKKYETSSLRARELLIDLASISEAADATDVSFIHKGEEVIDDLERFCPSWFKAVRGELTAIFPMICEGMTETEIDDVQKKIEEARKDYLTAYNHAWEKLLSSYHINDIANRSVSLLHTQGYQVEGFAYENGSEGEPLHINFVNPLTNDRLTLVVDADSSNNVAASLHQFGTSDSSLPDEDKQQYLMELIGSGIRSETGGRQLSVKCTSPHSNSREHTQANVQVKKSN